MSSIKKSINWHDLSVKKCLKELDSTQDGLLPQEVDKRLKKHGPNKLPREKRLTMLTIFFNQFKNSLIYILLIAGVISFFSGEIIDAYVIFAAVILNVIVGFIQERKAQKALAKLQSVVVPTALVIREGNRSQIPATEIVPGDIIVLSAGDKVAADARLIEAHDLEVEEAALTGESSPVNKHTDEIDKGASLADRENMVYMGTIISRGVGKAVVTATGEETQIGQIASMLRDTQDEKTPLQFKLAKFSRHLAYIILAIAAFVFVIGVMYQHDAITMFNTAVAIAVAAIPEGLVVAVTVILAIGMQRILKYNALVKKLVAAETLGSTTVICTDKTGTLTEGEMRVVKIVTAGKEWDFSRKQRKNLATTVEVVSALRIATMCNDAEFDRQGKPIGSATERALLLAGSQIGLIRKQLEDKQPRIGEVPFDSANKFMATIHQQSKDKKIVYLKGAPEYFLQQAKQIEKGEKAVRLSKSLRTDLKTEISNLSKQQLRIIAVGYKKVDSDQQINEDNALQDMVLVGFIAMKDPLREDSHQTLEVVTKAGVKTVMITGDNKETAKSIADELGLDTDDNAILTGEQMLQMDDAKLYKVVPHVSVYARVSPHDKLRIVKALQAHGEVVAMTGDGINDAPALKQADIGVALGSGTDVAKETADLVLLKNNYSAIAAAVNQGRVIYDNIKKVVLYLLSDSFSEVILITLSIILQWPLPLIPAQILWINLVTDGFPHLALTMEPPEDEVMDEPPQERDKPILDTERKILIATISIVTSLGTLAAFFLYYKLTADIVLARTVAFAALGIDSLLYVFSCRSLRHSIFNKQFFTNKYLLGAVFMGLAIQLVAIYVPFFQNVLRTTALGVNEWLVVVGLSIIVILLIELIKWIFLVRKNKK